MHFKEIDIKDLQVNPATLFDRDWAILSAGDADRHNSMLVSWGTVGTLWGKPIAMAFVRPQRHTFGFMEENECFTLSFYTEQQHGQIAPFGSKSGRDCDKYALTGMQPVAYENTTYVDGAKIVLVCRKMSAQDMDPKCFMDPDVDSAFYKNKDYHRVYVGEIVKCFVQDGE